MYNRMIVFNKCEQAVVKYCIINIVLMVHGGILMAIVQ